MSMLISFKRVILLRILSVVVGRRLSLRSWVSELLKSFDWGCYGVAYAVLFGSLARGVEKPKDVDVAISCLDRRCDGDDVLGYTQT